MYCRLRVLASLLLVIGGISGAALAESSLPKKPEKIIIDTDIGSDIDDAFAIALALQSPEVQILGISTASGDTTARARILDRMLAMAGHPDILIAVGRPTQYAFSVGRQKRFGETAQFAGASHQSAVDFILNQIRRSPGEITLITIGPLTNVGDLIDKDAQTFRRLKRVVMMGGSMASIETGVWGSPSYGISTGVMPEYNILGDIPAAQKLFKSGVPIYVIPLDATGQLSMNELTRDALFSKGSGLTDALALLYFMWGGVTPVLYDAMPVEYVVNPTLCPTEPLHIVVDTKGVTHSESGEPNAQVCLKSNPEDFFHFFRARFQ